MTILGIIGAALGLIIFPWAFVRKSNTNVAVFLLIFVLHVAAAVVYYLFAQENDADSALYYYDAYGLYFREGFGLSTQFLIWTVQSLRRLIGGTYLDYFLIFQAFGFVGMALLARTIEELFLRMNVKRPLWLLAVLLMPGLYFWTSAIGKDAPLFLACALTVWAVLDIKSRFLWFGVAVVIMSLIRAHIAFVAIIALALAVLTDAKLKASVRLAILGAVGVAGIFVSGALQEMFQLDVTNAASFTEFLELQNQVADVLGGRELADAPYAVRLLSLMFRPFFFDADGLFGLIASVENILMIGLFATLVIRGGVVFKLAMTSYFIRFCLFFAFALLILLAEVYYNVGLGLRQRTMALPALMAVFCAVIAAEMQLRQRRMEQRQPSARTPAIAHAQRGSGG